MLQRRMRTHHPHHHAHHHHHHHHHHQPIRSTSQDRVRTHMFFSSPAEKKIAKRKRRTHNKFQQMQHGSKRDEGVQVGPNEIDPLMWSGNQRVLHFGPMAQRDPFYYWYPKGWDVLYPAHFGFFPYRTQKFRGSSTQICVWAFGLFLFMGGCIMIYVGYYSASAQRPPFWEWSASRRQRQAIPPVQVAGPVLFGVGAVLILLALIYTISTSQFLNDKLRHYHHKDQAQAAVQVYTTRRFTQPRAVYEPDPYQPLPPPAHAVWENRWAHATLFDPSAESKLYPPVLPGYSTLSLHHSPQHSATPQFLASPYNTLRAISPAAAGFSAAANANASASTSMMFGRGMATTGGLRGNGAIRVGAVQLGDGEDEGDGQWMGRSGSNSRRQSATSLRRARSALDAANTTPGGGGGGLRRNETMRSQEQP